MTSFLEKVGNVWSEFSGRLIPRRDRTPINSVAALEDFAATRSAYVAQKTLYSYVKMRMGTRYPRMFEDDRLIESLNIAKLHVYAACLSDLTIYTVANTMHDRPIGNDARCALARHCYEVGLRENIGETDKPFSEPDAIAEFSNRIESTDWPSRARQPDNFTDSPRALLRWAPIADNLKRFDAEIVGNSIKFTWRDIREQFRKRIDADGVYADWLRRTDKPTGDGA